MDYQRLKELYHRIKDLPKVFRSIGLKTSNFSIISNNCTGGYVYQYFGIPYKTPTEGIGMSVDDYLKLIRNPKYYFSKPLEFISPETTQRYLNGEHFTYPVAQIDDITIYFRHYPTKEEANNKWVRRCGRINYDKLFVLLTESETMLDSHAEVFSKILNESNLKGILLTTKDVVNPNVKRVRNVPLKDGVPQWRPEIIIKSLNWKSIINSL